MTTYSPEVVQIMRSVFDEVMTTIPLGSTTQAIKAQMAEIILRAAAEGQTTYDGLLAAASDQMQAIISMVT